MMEAKPAMWARVRPGAEDEDEDEEGEEERRWVRAGERAAEVTSGSRQAPPWMKLWGEMDG